METTQSESMENPVIARRVRFEQSIVLIDEQRVNRHHGHKRQREERRSKTDLEKASLFQQLVDEENLFVALGWYQKNRMAQSFCDGIFDEVDIPRCYELSERLRALDNTGYDCIVSKTKASKCLDGLLSVLIRNGGWKDSTLISTPATRIHPPNPAVHIDTRSRDSNDTLDSNSNNNGEAFMEKSPNPATLASG